MEFQYEANRSSTHGKIPGNEENSGALGHGLSVGVGLALAAKRSEKHTGLIADGGW
jgi:transketolase N-terminal domain/subunit